MTPNIDLFQHYLNKNVKLTWKNGYYLLGIITETSENFIIFQTTSKRSMINKDEIRDIMEVY